MMQKEIKLNTEKAPFLTSYPYLDCYSIFWTYKSSIPSIYEIYNLDYKKIVSKIESDFKDEIIEVLQKNTFNIEDIKKENRGFNAIYILKKDLVLDIDYEGNFYILYNESTKDIAKEYFESFKKIGPAKPKIKSSIHLFYQSTEGLDLLETVIKKPKIDISLNYNDDLLKIHKEIVSNLNKKDEAGLHLFYGIPGTGKSTYIRYLVNLVKKKVIFLPASLIQGIDSPSFIDELISNKNSILVIEDAEEILLSRENSRNAAVSAILSITDGLLSEALNIQVIATFNTHLQNIDKALFRKGRMKSLYEFKALEKSKAQKLAETLGFTNKIEKDLSLAEIYHLNDTDHVIEESSRIGF